MKKNRAMALWYEQMSGLQGAICAVVALRGELIPIGLCSVENWSMGGPDSLRAGWVVHGAWCITPARAKAVHAAARKLTN